MARFMRRRLSSTVALGALALMSVGIGTSIADSVATTGNATSITPASATLHGVVNPTDADSAWTFQYGTSTTYGHTTGPKPVGTGVSAVSTTVTGLQPGTTYHFRVVVAQGSYQSMYVTGADNTFTTAGASGGGGGGGNAAFAKASLRSHQFKVKGGKVSLPFKCSGASGTRCRGKYSLTARAKLHGRRVSCGGGSFNLPAGRSTSLVAKVGSACTTLLKSATNGKRGAILKILFSTHQPTFSAGVTLIRS